VFQKPNRCFVSNCFSKSRKQKSHENCTFMVLAFVASILFFVNTFYAAPKLLIQAVADKILAGTAVLCQRAWNQRVT
jgi:hypothetical protein